MGHTGRWFISVFLVTWWMAPANAQTYFPPPEAEGGWRVNTDPTFLRSLGLEPERLREFADYNLAVPNTSWKPYADYKGVLVVRKGWIVGEWYNIPSASSFRTYLSSNGKAFAIAAFCILARDSDTGTMPYSLGAESKVYDRRWLPQGFPLSDQRKSSITFEQIFQHTSGLCPERTSSGESLEQGRDEWTDYVDWVVGKDERWPQTKPLYFSPGRVETFENGAGTHAYSSVGFCHLGLVFANVYQQPAHVFLWERLLQPIGFSGIGYHAPPSEAIQWFSAGGLRMTPRDYARFAYLLLHDGRWGDQEVVPSDWIRRFRQSAKYPNIRSNLDGVFGQEYPRDMFRIAGSGLNWAFIVPSLDLIALRTGRANNAQWQDVEKEFLRRLFLSLSDGAL